MAIKKGIIFFIFFFGFLGIAVSQAATSQEYEEEAQGEYYSGTQYLRHKEYDKALEQFEKLIRDYPQSEVIPEVYLDIGQVKALQDKDDEAISALKKSLNLKPLSFNVTDELVDLLIKKDGYNESNIYLEKLLAADKGSLSKNKTRHIRLLDKVWGGAFRSGLYKEGIKALDLIIGYFPDSVEAADAWLRKGNWYKNLVSYDLQSSIFCYKKVLELFPQLEKQCADASYEIAYMYFQSKRYKEAIPYFYLSIDKYNRFDALYYLAQIYQELKDEDSLEEIKQKMVSYGPVDARVYIRISEACRELGWAELAREFFKKAVKNYPKEFGLPDKRMLWFSDAGYRENASIVLGDLNGDSRIEVAYGAKEGIFVLRGSTGEPIWQLKLEKGIVGSMVLGDLNGDRLDDIVFSTGNDIRAVSGKDGMLIWKVAKEKHPFSGNLALGKFGGKTLDVVAVSENIVVNSDGSPAKRRLYCFNGEDGKERWSCSIKDWYSPLIAKDVNLDAIDDLALEDYSYQKHSSEFVLIDGKDGKPLWKFDRYGPVSYRCGVIYPVNSDPVPDIITIIDKARIVILDGRDGKELWSCNLSEQIDNLMVMDINNDKREDILVSKGKLTTVFFDMGKDTTTTLTIPRNSIFFRDYQDRAKAWAITHAFGDTTNLYEISSRLAKPLPELIIKSKETYPDNLSKDFWGGVYYDVSLVAGDIDGDGTLELLVNEGRLFYALKTNVSCPKNTIAWPMAGLSYRHNQVIE